MVLVIPFLIFFSVVGVSVFSYFITGNLIETQIEETSLPLTSDNVHSDIKRDLVKPVVISSLVAQDTFLRDWAVSGEKNVDEITKYLSEIRKTFNVDVTFISNISKNYYHSTGIVKKVAIENDKDKWFFEVIKSPSEYDVNIDIDTYDMKTLTIFVDRKVYGYGHDLIGVTGAALKMDKLVSSIEHYQKKYGKRIYLINREGELMINSSDLSNVNHISQLISNKQKVIKLLTSPSQKIKYENNGQQIYLNSRLISEFDWYLIVEEIDSKGLEVKNIFIFNLLLSLCVSVVVYLAIRTVFNGHKKEIERVSSIDGLTGVFNRKYFEEQYSRIEKKSKIKNVTLSLIAIDLDYFKAINDSYGHLTGDMILMEVGRILNLSTRSSDIVCRWGGEEFFILLTDCDSDMALDIAYKIQNKIRNSVVEYKAEKISYSCSMGVTECLAGESRNQFFERADRALYQAKNDGRDRIVLLNN